MDILAHWLVQTFALILTCLILPKLKVEGFFSALLTVAVISAINVYLWDAALFFDIPDTLSYHALVLVISNGAIFWTAVKLLPGIEIQGVLSAFLAPIIFSVINILLVTYTSDIEWQKVFDTVATYVHEHRDSIRAARGKEAP